MIACIVPKLLGTPDAAVLTAVAKQLQPLDYSFTIEETASCGARVLEILCHCLKRDVAAVTIHSGTDAVIPADLLQQFARRQIPLVTYDITPTECPQDWVGFDVEAVAESAVGYMVGLGHRRIISLGVYAHGLTFGLPQAMLQAFQRHQLTTEYFLGGDHEDWEHDLKALLVAPTRPTGIIIEGSSFLGIAMHVIKTLGLQIPSHISLLTIGHRYFMDLLLPSVSVITSPEHELAEHVARLLLHRITCDPSLGDSPIRIPIQPQLQKRATCTIPQQGN